RRRFERRFPRTRMRHSCARSCSASRVLWSASCCMLCSHSPRGSSSAMCPSQWATSSEKQCIWDRAVYRGFGKGGSAERPAELVVAVYFIVLLAVLSYLSALAPLGE